MSVNKHLNDHNITGIAITWGPCDLCFFDKEHLLGVMLMHIVDLQVLFSVAALLNLVFSLMPLAVFVLPLDESLEQGQNRSRMLTCIIPVVLL